MSRFKTLNKDLFDNHRSTAELEEGMAEVLGSPKDSGKLELIVARPKTDKREILTTAELDTEVGLVGDNWKARGFRQRPDGSAHPEMQLNIMNSRAAALIAGPQERWALAGDQLYVDMDLSSANLPAGTQLSLGNSIIEITAEPHLGCAKFSDRFGKEAVLFVNSALGKAHNLRGLCAKVIVAGSINVGDTLKKYPIKTSAQPTTS